MDFGNRSKKQVCLGIEPLESRLTPAGNLTAFVDNGTLVIEGDRSNHIIRVSLYDDAIKVETAGTINGNRPPSGLTSVTFQGDENIITALKIDSHVSDDIISIFTSELTEQRKLDITARTYGGRDSVEILGGGMIGGNLFIDTASGNDRVSINGNHPEMLLSVYLGPNTDTLKINGSIGQVLTLDAGGGKDSLEIPAALYSLYSEEMDGFETVKLI